MMGLSASTAPLKQIKAWEPIVRFVFGGLVTVLAGLVANAYGPTNAGLFLAFPAILPASLTLVARHQGRKDAASDARGATLGSIGLVAFALVIWRFSGRIPGVAVLTVALGAWAFVAFIGWWLAFAPKGRDAVAQDSVNPRRRPSAKRGP